MQKWCSNNSNWWHRPCVSCYSTNFYCVFACERSAEETRERERHFDRTRRRGLTMKFIVWMWFFFLLLLLHHHHSYGVEKKNAFNLNANFFFSSSLLFRDTLSENAPSQSKRKYLMKRICLCVAPGSSHFVCTQSDCAKFFFLLSSFPSFFSFDFFSSLVEREKRKRKKKCKWA